MRLIILLTLFFNVLSYNYEKLFNDFLIKYNKMYHSPKEFIHRLNIFIENHKFIEEHNKRNETFKKVLEISKR